MSLFVPECLEEVQTAGSHRHCDDLCLTHFSTAKGLSRGKKARGKNTPHIHMFYISASVGEDDISFLTPSHLKRANSICTPSCFSSCPHPPQCFTPSSGTLLFDYLLLANVVHFHTAVVIEWEENSLSKLVVEVPVGFSNKMYTLLKKNQRLSEYVVSSGTCVSHGGWCVTLLHLDAMLIKQCILHKNPQLGLQKMSSCGSDLMTSLA